MASNEPSATAPRTTRSLRLTLGILGIAVLAAAGAGAYFSMTSGDRPAPAESRAETFPLRLHPTPKTLSEFAFVDGAGRKVTLADFRKKVVLLNIWATWCPPCRKEMPALDRLQQQLGGPGFQVVALSIDRGGAVAVRGFYEETDVRGLAVYVDESGQAPSRLGVVGLPTTLLIDGAGREIGRLTGAAEWDSLEAIAAIRRHLDAPTGS
jgi:thiol-disulfide isomerase/thioredoxin